MLSYRVIGTIAIFESRVTQYNITIVTISFVDITPVFACLVALDIENIDIDNDININLNINGYITSSFSIY